MVANFGKKANREFFTSQLLFKAVGVVLVITVVVLVINDVKIYQKKRALFSQIDALQKQIENIETSSQTLKEEIANSDSVEYLEKLAYEQLGQQKPGEKQVIFILPEQKEVEKVLESENFWSACVSRIFQSWNWLKSKF